MYCQFCSVYLFIFIFIFFVFMSYFVRNCFCNRVKTILKKKKKEKFFFIIQKKKKKQNKKTKKKNICTPHPLYFLTFLFYFPSSSESAGQQLPGSTSLKMILIFCGHSGEGCENSDGMFLGVDSPVQQLRPSHLQTRAAWCSQNLGKR